MAQSNDKPVNAEPSKANNDNPSAAVNGQDTVIDIKKFLQRHKADYGKSASGLLEVIFKDKTMKESEWAAKAEETLRRQVKK
jgi:hypothetical protein